MTESVFKWPVRVYYEDTDAQAVVYYANYFRFLERARTEWLRALGVDQVKMLNDQRQIFVVASFNDELIVTAALARLTRASFEIDQKIFRGNELLLEGGVKVALLDADTMKPQRVPKTLFEGNEHAS